MNKKAFSYVRFSSAEQAKGRSQKRQEEDCAAYCRENNLELATGDEYRFFDAGRSGFKGEHLGDKGQLARFIKLVEDGTIERGSTLIVESLDRLDRRSVIKALPQFLDLLGAGIRIVTLTDRRVYTEDASDYDLLGSFIIMSRANEESSTKSRRVRDAMRKKHEAAREYKKPMGRAIPRWLELGRDGDFVALEERAQVVRRIFQLAIDGCGRGTIAKMLNADGVENFNAEVQRRNGKEPSGWGTSSVDKVLKNQAVIGRYQPFSVQDSADGKRAKVGEAIEGYYPEIVDADDFYRAKMELEERRTGGGTKQSEAFNVWQGVAKCIHCGTALHLINKGKKPKGGTYLQCFRARKQKGVCAGRLIRLDQSEEMFRGMLLRLESLSLVKDSSSDIRKKLAAAEGRLLETKDRREKYRPLLETAPSDLLAEIAAKAERDIEGLQEQVEGLKASLASEQNLSYGDFMQRLDLVTPEGRRKANTLVKRLGVLVHIGREEGYAVSQGGRISFGMAYRDGQAGYLGTIWRQATKGQVLHEVASRALARMAKMGVFVPATEAGIKEHVAQVDADERAAEAV